MVISKATWLAGEEGEEEGVCRTMVVLCEECCAAIYECALVK